MSDEVNLNVDVRDGSGTGNAREARRNGQVPGVIYGGDKDSVSIVMKYNEVLKAINSGHFIGSMVQITHSGESQKVLTKDIQFHPVTDFPMHVDFYRVNEDSMIEVEVSITLIGEDVAPGLKEGGTLNVVRHSIEVACAAGNIPDEIIIDVSAMEIGDSLHISEITLPDGVKSAITDRDPTILTVVASRAAIEEDEEDEDIAADEVPAIAQEGDEAEDDGDDA
ncbi:50S ribosomal protein L25/general stress protein Ctc [Robiginitomaculum antarcticum]|uniref:50S ribosomal protein L25/general stress protein Ctc n=1 Tax=Robiginitomaculum antarcticum TaxID=437507 RepID=UPI00037F561B|nr:50S ribosomal protein L25/general stress protein Ctc [Robiginitomaculum antarcticum]